MRSLKSIIEKIAKLFLQKANAFTRINNLFVHPLPQGIQHLIGGLDASISPQQQGFEIVENLRRQRIVTKVLEKTGHKTLTGLLEAAAKPAQPINFLKGNLINTTPLGRKHLSRPGEILIKVTQLRLVRVDGGLGRWSRSGCRGSLEGSVVQILLTLLALSSGLLEQRQPRCWCW